MIAIRTLWDLFAAMLREHWAYVWGAARKGCVDCSGALVYAYRTQGKSLPHGSNAIARGHVVQLLPIAQARPGMAAFKARAPSDKGWALPGKYRKGGAAYNGDINDYYHIGLIAEDGRTVLNAQSARTGFVASPITQHWTHCAYLKAVDYGAEDQTGAAAPTAPAEETAIVTAASGDTVRMRREPSTACRIWWRVPVGASVTVLEDGDAWCRIRYNGRTGYMMAGYLARG